MIKIDSRSSTPIYEQIINAIKENILKGIFQPGDKLLSVRELSKMILTNPNTVSKAYQILEREKVIETIRGRGTFVSLSYEPKLQEDKMKKIKSDLRKLIIEVKYMGVSKDEFLKVINKTFEELDNSK